MKRNIDCVERLLTINHSYDEIVEWLTLNKFVDEVDLKGLTRDRERAEFIYGIFNKKKQEDEIILLYFEWTVLPKETIKITCVTKNEEKFFTYGI